MKCDFFVARIYYDQEHNKYVAILYRRGNYHGFVVYWSYISKMFSDKKKEWIHFVT